jgi:hypothetical protein
LSAMNWEARDECQCAGALKVTKVTEATDSGAFAVTLGAVGSGAA